MSAGTDIAPEPRVWVCGACGKRARSRYGFDADGKSTAIDHGWDSSCVTWAVLCEPTSALERQLRESVAPSDAPPGYALWKAVDESAALSAHTSGGNGAADPRHGSAADDSGAAP